MNKPFMIIPFEFIDYQSKHINDPALTEYKHRPIVCKHLGTAQGYEACAGGVGWLGAGLVQIRLQGSFRPSVPAPARACKTASGVQMCGSKFNLKLEE